VRRGRVVVRWRVLAATDGGTVTVRWRQHAGSSPTGVPRTLGRSKDKDSDEARSGQRSLLSTAGHDKRRYPSASSPELTPSL
jgi:hypothetical protein